MLVLAANKCFTCEPGQNDSAMLIQVYQMERLRSLLVFVSVTA